MIPTIRAKLEEAHAVRDDWLDQNRVRLGLDALGIVAGMASMVVSAVAGPLTPLALGQAGLSLLSGAGVAAGHWFLDVREGRRRSDHPMDYIVGPAG